MRNRLFTRGVTFQMDEQIPLVILDLLESYTLDLSTRYRILLVKEGTGYVVSRESSDRNPFKAPVVICLNTHETVTLNKPFSGSEIVFHPLFLNPNYEEMDPELLWLYPFEQTQGRIGAIYTLSTSDVVVLDALIEKMKWSLGHQVDDYWPCRSRSYLIEALLFADRLRTRILQPTESDLEMLGVIEYLEKHFAEAISLESLTLHFKMNRTTLSERFKQLTGKPIMQYLIDYRIDLAKFMLRDTALTVSEVGERCGFSDYAYFNRAFKKKQGCSPRAFRKTTTWL